MATTFEVCSDGGFILIGSHNDTSVASSDAGFIAKLGPSGVMEWMDVLGGPYIKFHEVKETSGGSFVVVGSLSDPHITDGLILLKFSSDGELLWNKSYDFEATSFQIRVAHDGYVVAASPSHSILGGGQEPYIAKFDLDGNYLWDETVPVPMNGSYSLSFASDGGYVMLGTESNVQVLCKLDHDLETLWQRYFGINGMTAFKAGGYNDGSVWLICSDNESFSSPSDNSTMMMLFDTDGNFLFNMTTDWGVQTSLISPPQKTADGGFLVGGRMVESPMTNISGFISKLNSTGHVVWTKLIEQPGLATSTQWSMPVADGYVGIGNIANYTSLMWGIYSVKLESAEGPILKQNATLTLQSSTASATVNDDFTLTGTLSVPKDGAAILFWSVNCTCFNHQQDLNMTDGQFSTTFKAPSAGTWYFKSIWMGDLEYNSAQSNVVVVTASLLSVESVNVTFSQNGITEDVGVVLDVDGSKYTISQLPRTFTWSVGSSHSFFWYSPLNSSTTQYAWSSTSGLSTLRYGALTVGSGEGSVVATYYASSTQNRLPVPVILFSPSVAWAGLEITFNASASYDPDGTITSYAWDFGDFSSSSAKVVTHAYNAPGLYIVFLTVVDNKGAEGQARATVEVAGSFRLNITSNIGLPISGGGVYAVGSVVRVSAPSEAPAPGIMGLLGSKYVFQQWVGAVNSTQRTVDVTVDYQASRLGLLAVYTEQNTSAMIAIAAIGAVAIAAGALLSLAVVRKRKQSMFYVLAIFIIVTGIVGTVMGIIYSQQYWYDTGHAVVFSYGQIAIIVGPILAVIGVVLSMVLWKVLRK